MTADRLAAVLNLVERIVGADRFDVAGIAVLLLLPADVFQALQGPRDAVNIGRLYDAEAVVRTSFLNPFPPTDALAFVANYAYALTRLNVPILFSPAPQELALTLYMLLCGWLLVAALRADSSPARILSALFIAHAAFLPFFEPDLGSYFRHVSVVAPYLVPGILARFERRAV